MRRIAWRLALVALLLGWSMQILAATGDTIFSREQDDNNEYPPATFSHAVHRYQYKCYACHDDIFKMKKGANKVTMEEIGNGKFCGACHNETTAFGSTFESCARCHH